MAGTSKIRSIFVTTTAGEDETSEGNPGNRKGDAVDVTPSVPAPEDEAAAEPTTAEPTTTELTTAEPARLGPVVQELDMTLDNPTDVGLSSVMQARQGPQMRYCLWAPECVETPLPLNCITLGSIHGYERYPAQVH